MPHSRREFLGTSVATAGALALGPLGSELLAAPTQRGRSEGLHILILGGTGFIGPYVVRHAMQRGHTVTFFKTPDDLARLVLASLIKELGVIP